MQLLNDNKNERVETPNVGFLSLLVQVLFSAIALASVAFAPLPQIVSHFLFEEPWPKLTAILGAVTALMFFNISPPLVIFFFILSVVLADNLSRGINLLTLLVGVGLLSAGVGLGLLLFLGLKSGVGLSDVWSGWVNHVITSLKTEPSNDWLVAQWNGDWETLYSNLFYRGPFLLVAASVLCHWISIGLASHMQWIPAEHPYGNRQLRNVQLPFWLSLSTFFLFIAYLVSKHWNHPPLIHWLDGSVAVLSVFLFVDGCLQLSHWMQAKGIGFRRRTAIYSLCVVVGFYALVGLGLLRPWYHLLSKSWRTKNENHTP